MRISLPSKSKNYSSDANVSLGLSADEVLTTTRAVRRRLDFDRPVSETVIRECLDLALQAPTAALRQDWHFVVSTDPEQCEAVGLIYQESWRVVNYLLRLGWTPPTPTNLSKEPEPEAEVALPDRLDGLEQARFAHTDGYDDAPSQGWRSQMGAAVYLSQNFPRVPAILIPCIQGRMDGAYADLQAVRWGSVIQATWSFCLVARNRGLGTCWTTTHLARERAVAEVLGIPYNEIQQVALLPVAYTLGTEFSPATRKPLEEVVHFNGW